jgi:hypothetical protein
VRQIVANLEQRSVLENTLKLAVVYILAASQRGLPLYGLVRNGADFVFLKLLRQDHPLYARSRQFILGQDHDLEQVLQILKRLAGIVAQL